MQQRMFRSYCCSCCCSDCCCCCYLGTCRPLCCTAHESTSILCSSGKLTECWSPRSRWAQGMQVQRGRLTSICLEISRRLPS